MEDLKEHYKQSREALRNIFDTKVIPDYIEPATICDKPSLIFITAQQASGKTTIKKQAENSFSPTKPVAFCGDDMRKFDPNIKEIRTKYPAQQSVLTAYNAYQLRDMLMDKASRTKRNIVYEAVLKDDRYDGVKNSLNIALEKGYKAECWVLAVNEHESGVSMFERYEDEIAISGRGVTPHIKNHDEAYSQFPALVKQMQEQGMFGRVVVFDRQGHIYYDSTKDKNSNVIEGVKKGRSAIYNDPDWKSRLEHKWDNVMARMQERGATDKEKQGAESLRERMREDDTMTPIPPQVLSTAIAARLAAR